MDFDTGQASRSAGTKREPAGSWPGMDRFGTPLAPVARKGLTTQQHQLDIEQHFVRFQDSKNIADAGAKSPARIFKTNPPGHVQGKGANRGTHKNHPNAEGQKLSGATSRKALRIACRKQAIVTLSAWIRKKEKTTPKIHNSYTMPMFPLRGGPVKFHVD